MSYKSVTQPIRKLVYRWKMSGIFPILLLILTLLGVTSIQEVPVNYAQGVLASIFPVFSQEQSPSRVESSPIPLQGLHKNTQSASKTESAPGLIPADTLLFLEDRQFSCKEMHDRVDLYHWSCLKKDKDTEFEVGVFMKSRDAVYLIDTNLRQNGIPKVEPAMSMFSMFSDLSGLKIDREFYQVWLGEAVMDVWLNGGMQTENLGGVTYRVYGTKADSSIEIEIPQ